MPSVYATTDDLILSLPRGETELIELTDITGSGSTDDDRIVRALGDTASTIDTYLRRRYSLPLAAVPDVLRNAACDMARYSLYRDAAPQEVKDRFAAAMRLLSDLATGKAVLPGVAGDAMQAATPANAVRSGQGKSAFDWDRYP